MDFPRVTSCRRCLCLRRLEALSSEVVRACHAFMRVWVCASVSHLVPFSLFIALHGMQTRSNAVIMQICLSVKRLNCDKTEERFVHIFMPYERSFSLVFWEEEWLVGATPSTWNFGSTGLRWSQIADFEPIFARSAWDVTPSEKSLINTNRKSTTRFLTSLRWLSYVAPKTPKGGSKAQNGCFSSKIAFRLKRVCYKVSLWEKCQRQTCKAFIGPTIRAKMIGGGATRST